MKNTVLFTSLLLATEAMPIFGANTHKIKEEGRKPNILFLFIDDMAYDGICALGNKELLTPNMDGIINNGVCFTNTYIMGGWKPAISTASRSQLITGRYLWNCFNDLKKNFAPEKKDRSTWPIVMEDAGYKTYISGKWHVEIKAEELFDKVEHIRPGMPNQTKEGYNRPLSRTDNNWLPWDRSKGGFWKGGKHWTEVLADDAINYISVNKENDKPLFMYCAFNAVHDPRQAPESFINLYPVEKIKVPDNFLPEHPYAEQMCSGKKLRGEMLAPFPRTKYAVQKNRQEYYALTTHLDYHIGRILKTLKQYEMLENTLIILAADNGLAVGHHGFMAKQSMYDHSMKVPLCFSGLNLPKGEIRTQLTYLQDLVPTLYDIIGIQSPESMQFKSQYSVIKSKKASAVRTSVYGAYLKNAQRMVRNDRYKLFFIPAAKKVYLFDLKRDPMEVNNLYGIKKYNKIVKSLAVNYLNEAREAGDNFDLASYFPEIFQNLKIE